MINGGFTNNEISRALKIDSKTVRNYRGEKKDVKPRKNSVKSPPQKENKISNGAGDGSGGEINQNENIGSGGEEIEFIGGKEDMTKKDSETKEEANTELNLCGNCNKEVKGTPEKCPHCGSEFDYSD